MHIRAKDKAELQLNAFQTMRALEDSKETNFDHLLKQFQDLGGKIETGVVFEFSKEQKEFKLSGAITLPSNAIVYPVCEAGENRSQILALMLHQEHTELKVSRPHGAKGSIDPFILPTLSAKELQQSESADWEKEMAHQFYPVLEEPLYEQTLGTKRVSRVGETELKSHLAAIQARNIEHLKFARDYMDKNYFEKIINNGGHIISFNQSVHIMMMRLVEVATKTKKRLVGVALHPVQSDDPAVLKAYTPFYDTLKKAVAVRPTEIKTILPGGLMQSPYQSLEIAFKQFLSETTQKTRHGLEHLSTEQYWNMLLKEQQEQLKNDFLKQVPPQEAPLSQNRETNYLYIY